jgi:anti-sigma factor RsiW
MSTCKHAIQHLLEYLDGEISPDEQRELDAHLAGCEPCVEFVRSYRATPDLCRHHLVQRMPDEVADRLKAFLRSKLGSK